MLIKGQQSTSDVQGLIEGIQSLESGFSEHTEHTEHYFSRGESESLRAAIEEKINDDVKNDKPNPLRYNLRPIDHDAHRVEGGEVGFSDSEKLGTDNTHDCVVVMLHDPVSKKTALAHIGGDTTEASIQAIWDGMPQRNPDSPPFQMRLLGARQYPIDKSASPDSLPYQEMNRNVAQWNLEKVVRFFEDKPVDVISADVLAANQPAVVVVDPKTFNMVEHVPGKHNPNAAIVNGLGVLHTGDFLKQGPEGHNPLIKGFDLTESPERNPVLLSAEQVAGVHRFKSMDQEQLEHHFTGGNPNKKGLWLAQRLESTHALMDGYDAAVAPILSQLGSKAQALETEGISVDKDALAQKIQAMPLNIGHNADRDNKAESILSGIMNPVAQESARHIEPARIIDNSGCLNLDRIVNAAAMMAEKFGEPKPPELNPNKPTNTPDARDPAAVISGRRSPPG